MHYQNAAGFGYFYLPFLLNLIFLLSLSIGQAQAPTTSPVVSNNTRHSSLYSRTDVV